MRLVHYLTVLPHAAHRLGGWLLFLLAFVIGYDVIGRKYFNTGSIRLQDLEWHLHGAAMMLGFGAAYLRDAHVRVDLVREGFSVRTKAWLELVGVIFFLIPYCGFLIWFSLDYVVRAYVSSEGSVSGAGLPYRFIIKTFLTIGFSLVVLSAMAMAVRLIGWIRNPRDQLDVFDTFD